MFIAIFNTYKNDRFLDIIRRKVTSFMDSTLIAFLPLLSLFIYIAPVIFIIWFLFKFLKVQQEQVQILKRISDKLDQR